jgi:hypothetical protein
MTKFFALLDTKVCFYNVYMFLFELSQKVG